MPPAIISTSPPASQQSGSLLETISNDIDTVNILKGQLSPSTFPSSNPEKDKSQFRQYEQARDRVKTFYSEQHQKQTMAYNLQAREDFTNNTRASMSIWEAMERLDTLIDDSDPDTSVSQILHLLQTAEAIRRDGLPRWMQLTGLIHDLGKLLFFFGAQGQWDVVGDTFPIGCAFSPAIIYPGSFALNTDSAHAVYSSENGIYSPGCGMENLMLSWGHDEYLYHVVKDQSTLPREALAMIRYHSFYPWHKEDAYRRFMKDGDEEMLSAVRAFNPYDLYSKSDVEPVVEELKPYYLELIDEFFPEKIIKW